VFLKLSTEDVKDLPVVGTRGAVILENFDQALADLRVIQDLLLKVLSAYRLDLGGVFDLLAGVKVGSLLIKEALDELA
jgi:hypothetical protein